MATNRIDILDSALLRPGRIDRKIEFPAPTEDARLDILKIHSRKMNLTRGINLRKIAEMMPGASGAEVKVGTNERLAAERFHRMIVVGSLYRSWHVCTSRTTCSCYTGRF
jgi:ATP-dependent 26S proteasome regulatory subunit